MNKFNLKAKNKTHTKWFKKITLSNPEEIVIKELKLKNLDCWVLEYNNMEYPPAKKIDNIIHFAQQYTYNSYHTYTMKTIANTHVLIVLKQ